MIHRIMLCSSILVLAGCLKSEPKFKAGQCINPVDGSQIYKLSEVNGEQMRGQEHQGGFNGPVIDIPKRMFVEVPCPQ